MKVIFNVDAITHPITGIGHYALQLGRQLQQHQAVQDCKFYSSCRWIEDINNAANSNQGLSFARKYVPFKSLALSVYGKHRDRCFKRFTSSMQDHVFHSPNFLLMPFAGKSVSTIADLSFIHFPDQHPKSRLKFLEKQLPKTLEQATSLIAISEFVKNEIIDVLSVNPEKIHVTALGVDPKFKIYDHQENLSSLQKHGLHNKAFILSVATTEPRKNLQRLLDAYLLLDHKVRKNHPLVLVGSTGWLNKNLSAKINKLVSQQQIISLGYLAFDELTHIYSAAHACVFPSLYEGFGMPILEAMASGTPVLTSDTSSMPEVAAGNALLCNPLDVDDMAEKLNKLIVDQSWRDKAIQSGLEHSRKQSWLNCAEKTLKVYNSM